MTNRIRLTLFVLLSFAASRIHAQEMVILNDTIEWTMESTHGYYFFQPPASAPSNWLSPHDYYNGEFYTRYEIISEATSEPCGLQVGIWQWRLDYNIQEGQKDYSEIMASIVSLNGPGSVAYDHSSPPTWWRSYEGVDFSRVYDFWRLGINIWSLDPRSVIANSNWGGDNDLWAVRSKWFPIRVYVTVVAVAEGQVFSGWENYIDNKPPVPSYTIDFYNETTVENVPPTDEYAFSENMSGAVTGTNAPVQLVPGEDVYFRTLASGDLPASDIQHLVVPDRPGAPFFTYDGANERTVEVISAEYEYASDPDMSDATTGSGTFVSFPLGSVRYFRKTATSSTFSSRIQELLGTMIPAPAYTIDFLNERTAAPVAETDEYSYNNFATAGTAGSGDYLILLPGQDVYFRTVGPSGEPVSPVQRLEVPGRPPAPVYTIDFAQETTAEVITDGIEYSESPSFTVSSQGNNSSLPLEPGTLLYFRVKATQSSFRSPGQLLNVPQRPLLLMNSSADTITESPFTVFAVFPGAVTGFDLGDLEVTHGTLSNLRETYTFDFTITNPDNLISIKIPANCVNEGNFESEVFSRYFKGLTESVFENRGPEFTVYPVPVNDLLTIEIDGKITGQHSLTIHNISGKAVYQMNVEHPGVIRVYTGHLDAGTYVVSVNSANGSRTRRIIKVE